MVPCDVLVPRAKAMFSSPIGGVAQLGATVAATVTAVTTPTDESEPDPAEADSSFDLDELKAALLRKLQA